MYYINNQRINSFKKANRISFAIILQNGGLDKVANLLDIIGGNSQKHLSNVVMNMVNCSSHYPISKEELLNELEWFTKQYINHVLQTYYSDIWEDSLFI